MPLKLAIVGRPNVGKSTLFNRLAGKKLAIVDDRPGVTRDRREATGSLGDLELELIDTAGFEDVDDESLQSRMRAQTERAIDDADVCLFLYDAREGVTPLDRIFADLLRHRDKPMILGANKSEGKASQSGVGEGHALGLGEPIPVSGEHGEGMSDLYEALLPFSDAFQDELADEEPGKPVRIAIVGRPNAGKSTLVNRLIGEDRLLVGPEAGITRDAIPVDWTYDGRPVRLVDTAGLRRKARVQETLEKLSTSDSIRAITFAEVVVLVMDANGAFETQDLQLADLVEREGRALVYCIAKWDLVEEPQARLAELKETAERQLPQLRGTPLVALSAETGRGVDRLMPAVFKAHADWSVKVKTRDLNDWLALAVQRHPPPAVNGKRIKPKYMSQIKARPPTFVLFASRAEHLPEQYRRYLINSLRESFDLPGVPIRVSIRANKNPFSDAPEGEGYRAIPKRVRAVPAPKKPTSSEREGAKAASAKLVRGKAAATKPTLRKPVRSKLGVTPARAKATRKPDKPKPAHPNRVRPGPRSPGPGKR